MPKVKRDVLRYIDDSIEYERGANTAAPPGGYARGLDKAEADLVYLTVRKTLAAFGLPVKPEWFPPNDYQVQRLDNVRSARPRPDAAGSLTHKTFCMAQGVPKCWWEQWEH